MENKEKVKLNDDLLDKVVGGIDDDEKSWMRPDEWTPPPHYPIWHEYCGHLDYYDTPYPETCHACGMPLFLKEIPE